MKMAPLEVLTFYARVFSLYMQIINYFQIKTAKYRTNVKRYLMAQANKEDTPQLGINGWMTCNFTSFLTVFQSYQVNGWMIIVGCVQWNPIYN